MRYKGRGEHNIKELEDIIEYLDEQRKRESAPAGSKACVQKAILLELCDAWSKAAELFKEQGIVFSADRRTLMACEQQLREICTEP